MFSMEIWKANIFPSLFPFFILSDLINYGFIEISSNFFSPLMRLFKIKCECAYIFILSIFSGFPSNSKYTKELYDMGVINEYEATKVLTFTHFSNPLFILGTISIFLNQYYATLILISHYLGNIFVGLIFRNYHPSISNKPKVQNIKIKFGFIEALTNSIVKTINTLFLLLGIITTFLIITTIIDNSLNIHPNIQVILNGLIEMTQGLKYVSLSSLNMNIKAIISTFFISFGGVCIHIQVKSILKGTNIKYLPYLIARILHGIISCIILFVLLYL